MLKKILPLIFIFFTKNIFPHGAHEHGTAKIDIAADDLNATIHIEVPAMSIYGFEHVAKNSQDKTLVQNAVNKMKLNINKIVKFDPSLGCTFSSSKIDPFVQDSDDDDDESDMTKKEEKSDHGNFRADFNIKCTKKIAGTKVTFGFQKYFPNIKKLNVQGLSDESQQPATISDDKGFLQL